MNGRLTSVFGLRPGGTRGILGAPRHCSVARIPTCLAPDMHGLAGLRLHMPEFIPNRRRRSSRSLPQTFPSGGRDGWHASSHSPVGSPREHPPEQPTGRPVVPGRRYGTARSAVRHDSDVLPEIESLNSKISSDILIAAEGNKPKFCRRPRPLTPVDSTIVRTVRGRARMSVLRESGEIQDPELPRVHLAGRSGGIARRSPKASHRRAQRVAGRGARCSCCGCGPQPKNND